MRCVRFTPDPMVTGVRDGMDPSKAIMATIGYAGGIFTVVLAVLGCIAKYCLKCAFCSRLYIWQPLETSQKDLRVEPRGGSAELVVRE